MHQTNLRPFFVCFVPVAQQVADAVCRDDLRQENTLVT